MNTGQYPEPIPDTRGLAVAGDPNMMLFDWAAFVHRLICEYGADARMRVDAGYNNAELIVETAPPPRTKPEEGWTWLINATRWHYFRGGRSLCGRWGLFGSAKLEPDNHDSTDNCAECRRRIKKELTS